MIFIKNHIIRKIINLINSIIIDKLYNYKFSYISNLYYSKVKGSNINYCIDLI